MRADQLGHAIGMMVHTDPWEDPPKKSLDKAQCVIIVKRLKKRWKKFVAHLNTRRMPIIWDCVDFWQQPEENDVGRDAVVKQFHKQKGLLGSRAVIVATQQMQQDCGGHYLPHHHRVGLTAGPVRRTVRSVGYEGDARYLWMWRAVVLEACVQRGWDFIENPANLADVDIVVALRGGEWDGWACRNWKSGVKYVNAMAAGRPVISQPTAAFREIGAPGTVIETKDDLSRALDYWADYQRRLDAASCAAQLEPHYRLETIADRYRQILQRRDVQDAILGIKK